MENSAINKEEQPKINIQPKLRIKEKISYGAGDFASNLIWGTLSSFLLYFYTDIALLPVVATGSIFLISRMLDAFIDPFVGGFIEPMRLEKYASLLGNRDFIERLIRRIEELEAEQKEIVKIPSKI